MNKLRVLSFFAGVGGIDLGFEQTNRFKIIYANEFDQNARITFEENFDIKVDCRDINIVKTEEVPECDVIIGGFPCQAFSIAGYREGFYDKKGRGNLFFEMCRFIKDKKPRIVFLENVKNLVGHDNGNTFRVILDSLEKLGYFVKYQVLNAKDYGNVPHGRERIYIVGFANKEEYKNFEFPKPIKLTTKLSDVISFNGIVDEKLFYSNKSCNFFDIIEKEIIKSETIYQWRRVYVRENKSSVCPTLTANMGTGGHNVPLILTSDNRIRKLSPRECFNLQGFPRDYILPKLSNIHLYKQAGNSVVVPVIKRIAEKILDSLEQE